MAERKAFLLRIDPVLWQALETLAQNELRSVNAQIEFMLRESLAKRGVKAAAAPVSEPADSAPGEHP
jgi:hypothetical protein